MRTMAQCLIKSEMEFANSTQFSLLFFNLRYIIIGSMIEPPKTMLPVIISIEASGVEAESPRTRSNVPSTAKMGVNARIASSASLLARGFAS